MKIRCPESGEVVESSECEHFIKKYPAVVRKVLIDNKPRRKKKQGKPQYGVGRLVNKCIRSSYYGLVEDVVHSPEKLWIFKRGHAIHEFLQAPLQNDEKEIFVKIEFPKFNIIGFIDAISERILYEFKTTANIPVEPQNHHILQAQGYYSMLSPDEQAKIDKILIIYVSLKDIKTFEIPKRNILSFLESRAAILTNSLDTKIPPAAEKGWLCRFCDFKDLCETQSKSDGSQRQLMFL